MRVFGSLYKAMLLSGLLLFLFVWGASEAFADGCAKADEQVKKEEVSDEMKVGERAIERWEALIAGDWDEAYKFETPGYRAAYTVWNMRDSYGGAVAWKGIKLMKTEAVDDKTAKVMLELTFIFNDGDIEMTLPSVINEQWLKKDDEWWFVRQ